MKKRTDAVTRLLKLGSSLVSVCAGLLAVVLILYSGYVLYDSMAIEISAFSSSDDLLKYKPSTMAEARDGNSLADINPDYRAWITVPDNPIDYPVVQGEDDLYYASHDANRENSLTGAIYMAANNSPDFSDSYNLLYGHHMDNGAMFGSLDRFADETYFHAHQAATLITKDGVKYDVTFFSTVNTDAYEQKIYTVGNRAREVISFLTGSRDEDTGLGTKVLVYDEAAAADAKKVLALSTCANATTNGRLVVFGRMTVHEEETPTPEPTETPGPTDTPTATPTSGPTATPTAAPTVTLTIHYLEDGEEVFPTVIYPHKPGDSYYVVSPYYPGHDVDIEIVEGTIYEDTVIYVHYTPRVYRLIIHYLFMDGTEAAGTYATEIHAGEAYDVSSPAVEGYRALRASVSGTNPGRDEEYTVFYVPEGDSGEYYDIDSYETPTGLEATSVQIGICTE